ncbi:unnamed protein product [Amoebophrya sp. A25]|nr:unnamed protein product [Amoebophrya sp. A25]|eukprot:GSA25T00027838001.1
MCVRAFAYYSSFLSQTQSKTREDFIELFARALILDVILFLVQIPSVVIGVEFLDPSWVLVRVILLAFLLADAIAIAALRCKVLAYYNSPNPAAGLVCVVRFVVGWSATTVMLYAATKIGEVVSLHLGMFDFLLISAVVALKILRVMAIASFESWLNVAERPLVVRGVRAQV